MAASVFNTRTGRVVEADILRRYGSSVTSDPSSAAKDFILVLSVGHCKFRLSQHLIENLLQAVIGGSSRAFRVVMIESSGSHWPLIRLASISIICALLNVKISRSSSISGTMEAPILKLNIVIGALSKLLNGWKSLSASRYVLLVPILFQLPFLLFAFLLRAPIP